MAAHRALQRPKRFAATVTHKQKTPVVGMLVFLSTVQAPIHSIVRVHKDYSSSANMTAVRDSETTQQ